MADADETEDIQDSEMTRLGPRSAKHSRKKAKASGSSGVAEPTSSGATKGGLSTACAKDAGQTKWPKPKLDLRALFEYHFRKKPNQGRKRKLKFSDTDAAVEAASRQRKRRVVQKRGRRRRGEGGLHFPFLEKQYGRKYPPVKMVRRYEQAALQGFFNYVEMLKGEHQLKKSLTQLDAGDELENGGLESRKHRYLDDDASLSPISDSDTDDDSEDEDIGARVVDNRCFILSQRIPREKISKGRHKRSQTSSSSSSN